ncbi:MAG TPA: hypothetical protein PLU72_09135 [Candidatus Ozemobacteraceae bacterium]|nr:hypothetical protein [Candidatus Ozemobacteraceae bacterium]
MGALPVDLPAVLASGEQVVSFRGARRNAIQDSVSRNGLQQTVAQHAARKRGEMAPQRQPSNDFPELSTRLSLPYPPAATNGAVHEQPDVARQDEPAPGRRRLDDLVIRIVISIHCIESQQPQPAGQFAEMHVENESPRWIERRLQPALTPPVAVALVRENLDAVARCEAASERRVPAVDRDGVDFRMRDSQPLYHVLHGGRAGEFDGQVGAALPGRKEILQFPEEAHVDHGSVFCAFHTPMIAGV